MAWSRREFLKTLGWSAAGVTVFAGGAAAFSPFPALPHRDDPTLADAAAWLSLRPDGHIEIVSPRAEIGQGIAVSLRQIVAEETGLALERIVAIHPRTDRLPPVRATVGSDSIKDFGSLVATAAAALALAIRLEAGKRLGVEPSSLSVVGETFRAQNGGAVSLAEIGAGPPLVLDATALDAVRPKSFDRSARRAIVGRGLATDQMRAIVAGGEPVFADDIRLPGMAFGAVLRPPRLGARLEGAEAGEARAVPGFVALHVEHGFAGLIAETRGALERALPLVRASWSGGGASQDQIESAIDIDAGLADGSLEHVERSDSLGADERFDVDLRLDVPMAAHAFMEPRTAVARFSDDRLDIWTGTQDVSFVRKVVAKAVGLSEAKVVVRGMRVGGGFGGKAICLVELEAARLARATGRPVKVQWTRGEEFRDGYHRPPSSHRLRARLTPDGKLDAWWHAFRSGHVIFSSAFMGPVLRFATSFVGDFGVLRGALPPYASAKTRVEFEDVRLPVHTGPWRGLGAAPNVWAIETTINALARKAGRDPIAFRLGIIDSAWPRLARVLERVAGTSAWRGRRSTPERGFGVACGVYKEMSYAAAVAEVARDGAGFRVDHLWCAHDCGFVINPDQVRAQIEGNLVWGIGMALWERLAIEDGHIGSTSYADYDVPRYSDVPAMTIDLVDGGEPPTGAGETAIVAGAAAVTNAITAMTGKVVTKLPAA